MARISSRVIIFNKDKVLLMFRRKKQINGDIREYYVVPGGGCENNQTLEQNAIRELKEEMNIDIKITNYVGLDISDYGFANYFVGEIESGELKLGGEEKLKSNEDNFYLPMFVPISKLNDIDVVGRDYIIKAFNKEFEKLNNAILTDQGICPTCYDRKFNGILYGDNSKNIIYRDKYFEAFLSTNPRARGHVIISTLKHFKDMMEVDDKTCKKIFKLAKKIMCVIKEVYKSESVYLCTMCDGLNNHFHLQLIPRYDYEKRGSINFVKERKPYIYEKDKIEKLRDLIKK